GGRTPAHWASVRGHFELAARLAGAEARRIARRRRGFLHTGIKAIDLLAPIPRGGRVHLVGGPYGVGMMVLMGELLFRMRTLKPVMLAVGDRFTDAEDFRVFLREAGLADAVTLLTTEPDDTPEMIDALAAKAVAAAGDGLLLVDRALDENLTQTKATTILFEYYSEHEAMNPVRPAVDTTITLSHTLARQRLYPAVDETQSRSTAPVTPEHHRIATEVRAALTAGSDHLRGYLTQPFLSVETFYGVPGQTVQIEDALTDAAALLAGEYDDVPAERLRYLGRVSEGRIQGV
ncbi:MAG: F-type H+-transporting ATPase subunit beta, partial [Myxococcota bacterium]